MRVTDAMVEHWLVWARNFGEIVAWRTGRDGRVEGRRSARRFRVRLTPGITYNGDPFRPKEGILDIFGHAPEDVVPAELMLTAREALVFGMGCAVGRAAALAGPEKDWQRERQAEWATERENFIRRREEARERNRADLDREAAERAEERQRRMEEYRRRREGTRQIEEESDAG